MPQNRRIKIISIDFQKDFTSKGGACYKPRKSVKFVKEVLVPFIVNKNIQIAEIISDYRQPRPGDQGDLCHPDKKGYESEIPEQAKIRSKWVKCMNSPLWIRKNIGLANKSPGLPYEDPKAFNKWLEKTVGKPNEVDEIVLIGLTVDCCVLCTAQELTWRGYTVSILAEAVDTYSGNPKEKEKILHSPPLTNWAKPISYSALRKKTY